MPHIFATIYLYFYNPHALDGRADKSHIKISFSVQGKAINHQLYFSSPVTATVQAVCDSSLKEKTLLCPCTKPEWNHLSISGLKMMQ